MGLVLAEVQSAAVHCWESKSFDQTRFTFSIIETRAAAQTDIFDMGVFSGKQEGTR